MYYPFGKWVWSESDWSWLYLCIDIIELLLKLPEDAIGTGMHWPRNRGKTPNLEDNVLSSELTKNIQVEDGQ